MIVSAHQPHYMPWTGYINRLMLSDIFVIMDNMEFTNNNYIHRNRIIQTNKPLLLTLPIKNKKKLHQPIKDIELDYSHGFRGTKKHLKSIEYNYKNGKGFQEFFPLIQPLLIKKHKWLIDIDVELLHLIKNYLNIDSQIILASEKNIGGQKEDALFISLLEKTNGNQLLLGMGASTKYINNEAIENSGKEIFYQKFDHPIYTQLSNHFIKGVSVIDLLLNVKRSEAIELISNSGTIEKRR